MTKTLAFKNDQLFAANICMGGPISPFQYLQINLLSSEGLCFKNLVLYCGPFESNTEVQRPLFKCK